MLRIFHNISGSPEVKMRRQSPVIAGARFYPGSSIQFTEAEWTTLNPVTKNILLMGAATGAFVKEELPDPAPPPVLSPTIETVAVEEPEEAQLPDEKPSEDQEPVDSEQSEEKGEERVEDKVVEKEPLGGEAEHSGEMSSDSKKPEEKEPISPGEFDYVAFLGQSIPKIKKAFKSASPTPPVDELIAQEKAGQDRSSLIGWFKQQVD